MLIISAICFIIAIYCIIAQILKVSSFKTAKLIGSMHDDGGIAHIFTVTVDSLAAKCENLIPLGTVKAAKLEKTLSIAGINQSGKRYLANLYITFLSLSLLICLPLLVVSKLIALIALVIIARYVYLQYESVLLKAQNKRGILEAELPQFTSNFANRLKTSTNVLDAIDEYRRNFSTTALSNELAITVADMRTGSQAIALQRLEVRLSSPFATKLIRGILSTMAGEDMTLYFAALTKEMDNEWANRLTLQAHKIKDKISRMTMIRALLSIVSLALSFFITISGYASSIF